MLTAAATLTWGLAGCTRAPDPEPTELDARRKGVEDTKLCEQYAQAAERVIKRYHSEPVQFLKDIDQSKSAPEASEALQFAPPWTVRWSCTQTELSLRTRLPNDLILSALGNSAQVILNDLVRGIRQDGLDPKADNLWIFVEVVDADDKAKFDPRQPYVQYR